MSRLTHQLAPVLLTEQLQPADCDLEACNHATFQPPQGGFIAASIAPAVSQAKVAGVGNIHARRRVHGRAVSRVTSDVLQPDAGTNLVPTICLARQATAAELVTAREQLIG
jgi:hypothetical protein